LSSWRSPSLSSAKVNDEVISEKSLSKALAPVLSSGADDLFFGLAQGVESIAAQTQKVMAIRFELRVCNQAADRRVIELEPFQFEKKQQVANVGGALLVASMRGSSWPE
jgi:hypothetical protein